jgi:hypothetical protein
MQGSVVRSVRARTIYVAPSLAVDDVELSGASVLLHRGV